MNRNLLYIALIVSAGFLGYFVTSQMNDGVWLFLGNKTTTEEVVEEVTNRLTYDFEKDRWGKLVLLALKEEKVLEVWGISLEKGTPRRLKLYPIDGYVGGLGPKLNPLDNRVPEGVYQIVELEPNHNLHRGLMLNYPNELDRTHGVTDQSDLLGYRFTIHGSHYKDGAVVSEVVNSGLDDPTQEKGVLDQLLNLSDVEDHSSVVFANADSFLGNLSLGDDTIIDELFTMVYEIGKGNVTVIVAPFDFRKQPDRVIEIPDIDWEDELYNQIKDEMILQLGSFER